MIRRRKGYTIQLDYFDLLIKKWKRKKPLTKIERQDLKSVLSKSDICKCCGEINNKILENKIEYCQQQSKEIEWWNKWFFGISILMMLINIMAGISLLIITTVSWIYLRKLCTIIKCLNCGANDSFVKIRKYMKKKGSYKLPFLLNK